MVEHVAFRVDELNPKKALIRPRIALQVARPAGTVSILSTPLCTPHASSGTYSAGEADQMGDGGDGDGGGGDGGGGGGIDGDGDGGAYTQ